jgi:hypothetical protein
MLALVKGSGGPKWLVFVCPCGCGETRRVSVSPAVHPAWRLVISHDDELSLYPSVWLQSECEAHFILRDNVAVVF